MTELTEYDTYFNGSVRHPVRMLWDFPESDTHFKMRQAEDGRFYRVFKRKGRNAESSEKEAASVLSKYQSALDNVLVNMNKGLRSGNITEKEREQIELFLKMHQKNGKSINVREIHLGPKYDNFIGMNKPYQLRSIKNEEGAYPIGPSVKDLREICGPRVAVQCSMQVPAQRKGIGGFSSPKAFSEALSFLRPTKRVLFFKTQGGFDASLFIHELAHTIANHVMFRPDDHYEDFDQAEKLVKRFFNLK